MAKPTIKDKVYSGLVAYPTLRPATNQEIAHRLKIYNPLNVSQALSKLHDEGKIRIWFDGEKTAVRHIDVL